MDKKGVSKDLVNNSVPAAGQTAGDGSVRFYPKPNARKKILFIGNSITFHGSKPEIGWYGNHGMAASAPEKDYAHLVVSALEEKYGTVEFCIAQLADWERCFYDDAVLEKYAAAKNYDPDTIVVRIGENVNRDMVAQYDYGEALDRMIRYFNGKETARVIVTGLFWHFDEFDAVTRSVADRRGYAFVPISYLGDDDANKALDTFDHPGVSIHPGDLGMRRLADSILEKL